MSEEEGSLMQRRGWTGRGARCGQGHDSRAGEKRGGSVRRPGWSLGASGAEEGMTSTSARGPRGPKAGGPTATSGRRTVGGRDAIDTDTVTGAYAGEAPTVVLSLRPGGHAPSGTGDSDLCQAGLTSSARKGSVEGSRPLVAPRPVGLCPDPQLLGSNLIEARELYRIRELYVIE